MDVETANRNRGSVCAFGLVVVRDGIMIEHHSWLGRPPGRLDWFDPFNIGIHGIHPEDVARQPGFADRLTQAMKVIGDLPVVAHYAAFDIGAIRDGCDADGLVWPNLTYGCTVVLSRRELDLLSYQLPIVAAELGITLEHHHDAGADASAAAQILIALARRRNASTFTDLLAGLRVTSGSVTADRWAGCHRMPDVASRVLPHASPDADPAHPLCGQVMVFTGGLSTMRREDAWTRVALLGATPAKNISTRTTMLVVGNGFTGDDPTEFRTGKAAKAAAARARGQAIEVLTEWEFLAMLDDTVSQGVRTTGVGEPHRGLADSPVA